MTLFKHYAGATRSSSIALPTIGLLLLAVVGFALAFAGSARSAQATVNLGDADSFGALSFTAMTNAGEDTVVNGNIGSSTSIGTGVTHPAFNAYGAGSSELAAAQASLLTAYNFAEAQTPNQPTITGANLAGMTLGPGVYNSTGAILISGPIALTLDGGGDPNAVFIFQAASDGDLTVDPTSSVTYANGAQPCNVFWKVNSAFLKNTDHTFIGTILALTQITLTEHITVEGRVLARNADVTFIHDVVNKPSCAAQQVTTTETSTAATTTGETTTEATTTAQTTTTSQATTTTPPATTTPVVTSTPATTTTPATPTTTTTTVTSTTTPTTTTRPTTTTTTTAKPGAVKGATKTRGHARPARRNFGFTG
jgi:hypothetical protein